MILSSILSMRVVSPVFEVVFVYSFLHFRLHPSCLDEGRLIFITFFDSWDS